MNSLFDHWYLSLIPLAGYLLLTVISMKRISEVRTQLRGVIRTRKDLELVKTAINQNMRLALVLILGGGGYLLLLVGLLASKILPASDSWHLTVFTVVMALSSVVVHILEKPLKTLHVEAKDSRIAQTYQTWLRQWSQARWGLQEDIVETLPPPVNFGTQSVHNESLSERTMDQQPHLQFPSNLPPPARKELAPATETNPLTGL
ncbi:MAG TPA: hypothetical protein PLU80_23020, partial [Acidobacteriota bacterium]|nr:hypothetical protein [Acidobacteriota bacterium]